MLKMLSEAEFARRTAGGCRTPVYREFLADRETPVAVLTRVVDDESVFLLESVAGGERPGRYSYLGIDPAKVLVAANGEDPLAKAKEALYGQPFSPAPELPSFQGGVIGYVAYDAVGFFEPHVRLSAEAGTPSSQFLVTDTVVILDHVRQSALVVRVVGVEAGETVSEVYARTMKEIETLQERLLSAESIARCMERRKNEGGRLGPFTPEMSEAEFEDIVSSCKDAIRAGEVIQIVPSQKFTAETDISALDLYRALRMVNPSPYNFFLKSGGRALIGSSPEELVKLEGRRATTAPIAGTRPRGSNPDVDKMLETELLADEKERAEHVMLVDLGRNDLGRVSKIGSVRVDDYARVERYSHVMHLVSDVSGELRDDCDAFDLLRATFPAGTLTGAPKVRAMELLAGLEKSPRGVYGGVVGYFSYTGDMDFAIVIRTMMLKDGLLAMRAGAGIVADSDPAREYHETLNKCKAVFDAARYAAEL